MRRHRRSVQQSHAPRHAVEEGEGRGARAKAAPSGEDGAALARGAASATEATAGSERPEVWSSCGSLTEPVGAWQPTCREKIARGGRRAKAGVGASSSAAKRHAAAPRRTSGDHVGAGKPFWKSAQLRAALTPVLRVSRHLFEGREGLRRRMRNGAGLRMAPGRLQALGDPNSRRLRLQGRAERGQNIGRERSA